MQSLPAIKILNFVIIKFWCVGLKSGSVAVFIYLRWNRNIACTEEGISLAIASLLCCVKIMLGST